MCSLVTTSSVFQEVPAFPHLDAPFLSPAVPLHAGPHWALASLSSLAVLKLLALPHAGCVCAGHLRVVQFALPVSPLLMFTVSM